MGKIHILDKSVSNMIAAGEVVERPLSIVKELIENSIDAGATTITVTIADGGISLIRVADNGSGMSEDDAQICFLRHATSKIKTGEDLDAIFTLGFRGEALSSIGAVSKAKIYTKRPEDTDGVCVTCEGGKIVSSKDMGTPNGTIVEVRDLFFNTPARKKFLKKPQVEGAYVGDIIERYTLSYPQISFKFIRDGKEIVFSSGDNRLKNAVYAVYGKDYATKLIDVDYTLDDVHVTGVIGPGTVSRPNRNYESFFVNRRYIKSALICRAVEEAYKNQVMIGKFPMAVLNIEIEPHKVDINVHPTKLECKFSNDELIYKAVYTAVRDALYKIPNVPTIERDTKKETKLSLENFKTFGGEQGKIQWQTGEKSEIKVTEQPKITEVKNNYLKTETTYKRETPVPVPLQEKQREALEQHKPFEKPAVSPDLEDVPQYFHIVPINVFNKPYEEMTEREQIEWDRKKRRYFNADGTPNTKYISLYCDAYKDIARKLEEARLFNRPVKLMGYNEDMAFRSDEYKCFVHCVHALADETGYVMSPKSHAELIKARTKAMEQMNVFVVYDGDNIKDNNPFEGDDFKVVGQLFNTYIIVEKGEDMLIIDQHAAHERLNFEALKKELRESGVTSQMVMIPAEFPLRESEKATALENEKLLKDMGFEFVIEGDNAVVSAMPAGIGWSDCEDLFLELIDEITDNRREIIGEKTERMLYSISCKASIKANMHITTTEMQKLVEKVFALDNINSCPHGRPIVISMSKKEIEKDFKRIV